MQALIIETCHLLSCILFKLDFVLELGRLQQHHIHLFPVLDVDFTLELLPEGDFFSGHCAKELLMTVVSQYVKQVLQLSLLICRHYVTLKALLSFILIIASFECCKDLTHGKMPLMHLEEFFHQLFLHCSDAYELLNVVALIIYVTLHL